MHYYCNSLNSLKIFTVIKKVEMHWFKKLIDHNTHEEDPLLVQHCSDLLVHMTQEVYIGEVAITGC